MASSSASMRRSPRAIHGASALPSPRGGAPAIVQQSADIVAPVPSGGSATAAESNGGRGRRRAPAPLSFASLATIPSMSLRYGGREMDVGGGSRRRSRSRRSTIASDATTPRALSPMSMTSDAGDHGHSERHHRAAAAAAVAAVAQSARRGGKRRQSTEHAAPGGTSNGKEVAASRSNSGGGRSRRSGSSQQQQQQQEADSQQPQSGSSKRKAGGRRSQQQQQQLPDAGSAAHFLQPAQAQSAAAPGTGGGAGGTPSSSNKRARGGNRSRSSGGGPLQQSAAPSPTSSPIPDDVPHILDSSYYPGGNALKQPPGTANDALAPPGPTPAFSVGSTPPSSANRSAGKRGRGTRGGSRRGQKRKSVLGLPNSAANSSGGGGGVGGSSGGGPIQAPVGSITPARLPAARFGTPFNSSSYLLNNVSRASPDLSYLLVPPAQQYGSMAAEPWLVGASPSVAASERREDGSQPREGAELVANAAAAAAAGRPHPLSAPPSGASEISSVVPVSAFVNYATASAAADAAAVPMSDTDPAFDNGADDSSGSGNEGDEGEGEGLSSINEEDDEQSAADAWKDDMQSAADKLDGQRAAAAGEPWQPDMAALIEHPPGRGRRKRSSARGARGQGRSRKKRRTQQQRAAQQAQQAQAQAPDGSAPSASVNEAGNVELRAPVAVPSAAALLISPRQQQQPPQEQQPQLRQVPTRRSASLSASPSGFTATPPLHPSPV